MSLALAASGPLAAQPVSYSQGTFNAADWVEAAVVQTDPFTLSVGVGGGGDFWSITQSSPPSSSSGGRLQSVQINRLFTYNPATNGALASINFSFDLFGVSTEGISGFLGFFRPVIRQGGSIFSVAGTNIRPTLGTNTTHPLAHLASDDWVSRIVDDPRVPDFSATGGVIEFGWRFDGGAGCSGGVCSGSSLTNRLDNYSVQVVPTVQSIVPEPSTYGLMALGLSGLFAVARRRRVVA